MLITVLGKVLPIWMSVTHYWYLNFACWFLVELSTLPRLADHLFSSVPTGPLACLSMPPSLSFNPSDHRLEGLLNRGGMWSALYLLKMSPADVKRKNYTGKSRNKCTHPAGLVATLAEGKVAWTRVRILMEVLNISWNLTFVTGLFSLFFL